MPVNVLVVDDSAFFRQRVTTILNSDPRVKVVGTAENGQVAIEKAKQLKPDVITMDYEMPVLNGIAALTEIMRSCPTPVLMFSSLTYEGARITLEALEAGAVDYLPKSYERMGKGRGSLEQVLIERVLTVSKSRVGAGRSLGSTTAASRPEPSPGSAARPRSASLRQPMSREIPRAPKSPAVADSPAPRSGSLKGKTKLVIFGTSTGGPVAIQKILTRLPASFPLPILIVQHMPKTFTGAFAERLNQQCQIQVREAVDGDQLKPGVALLAPGGEQMMVDPRQGRVRIMAGDERLNYKPSVDVTFGSAAKAYGSNVLGIVLTGMGADGRDGARMLKNSGSTIWAQNEQSCVIYGMPQAIAQAKLADHIVDLDDVSNHIKSALGY
ncbi:chemotaxis response regulator protein-glutamate methylesterase [Motiliproteus coralliicola]|uniref:Protein-glutamate methylesterase/protein-glutamine glutaminase n=1 Tax=Motiliproteus coralliicola TaxID=2283196 RepID=A0A369WL51_9GAMM|nr:chemotaxis response regulator protein-glutamate methylesterase [Motiliproteus coralliicola]RDE22432.1 chemotaxis response regulator protein-glutamate methylesterase [Motiliproteus coralliicola]